MEKVEYQQKELCLLHAGSRAPDFTLPISPTETLSLHDYHGRPLILAFYTSGANPDCVKQLLAYQEILPELAQYKAELIAISVDDIYLQEIVTKQNDLRFALLSDANPHGDVARSYGVFDSNLNKSSRALFVINDQGLIIESHLYDGHEIAGEDGVLEILARYKDQLN